MADKQFVGKGKEKKFDNGGAIVNFSFKPDDLPPPNDKGYVNLTLAEMKSPDKWGNTHTVYVNDWKPKTASHDRVEDVPDGDGLPF